MADLFSDFQLKDVRLKNRMAVSPMCQYSANDGLVNAWHMQNYGSRAAGGAGLVIAEASAVSPEGRITPGDAGLWTDAQADAWRPIVDLISAQGAVPGVQIAHAGRKASANRPWEGDDHLDAADPLAWEIVGPSDNAFGANLPRAPRALSVDEIGKIKQDFADAAKRALAAGFRWLELHFAHGYLGQSFFSPLANQRTDQYGGSFDNRARFLLETLAAVRAVWPEHLPLTARLGVTDFTPGEQAMEESIELIRQMKAGGLDLIDVSMGFNTPDVSRVPWGDQGFMGPIAQRIGQEVGIPTATSWSITDAVRADEMIRNGEIDLVMLGRAVLADPHWPYHAAKTLGRAAPQDMLAVQYAAWLKR
jgi:2,4-dienoyl-CoA reductase-like NADH-dependent reductase (Old Yellow Enzyme family)